MLHIKCCMPAKLVWKLLIHPLLIVGSRSFAPRSATNKSIWSSGARKHIITIYYALRRALISVTLNGEHTCSRHRVYYLSEFVCVRYSFVSPKTEIPGAERVFCACREIRTNTQQTLAEILQWVFQQQRRGARHKFKLHPSACV
jgi:hypothetical protein